MTPWASSGFTAKDLNTAAWRRDTPRSSSGQLGSCVSPLTCEGWNARVFGQTRFREVALVVTGFVPGTEEGFETHGHFATRRKPSLRPG